MMSRAERSKDVKREELFEDVVERIRLASKVLDEFIRWHFDRGFGPELKVALKWGMRAISTIRKGHRTNKMNAFTYGKGAESQASLRQNFEIIPLDEGLAVGFGPKRLFPDERYIRWAIAIARTR
jgi:hypothetical protein